MGNTISYNEYQALSDEEKQNWIPDWNSDGKSGIARRKDVKTPEVKPVTSTTELKSADPSKTSDVIKVKNFAQLNDLQRKWKDGWLDEKTQEFHINDKITEDRAKKAEEDKKQGRDYKNAETPSDYEKALREGKFDNFKFSELVEMRNKYRDSGDDVWKKIQDEINKRPEGKAEIAENKKKAEEAAKAKAEAEADKGAESEPVIKDTRAEDEALDKKEEALDKVLDKSKTRREELDEEWDKLLADNEAELDKHKDAADLSRFLPRFAIQHYLEGNFGKRGSAKAIGTLGYFLLDKIGASLVNASQVARGMSPTQKTALEQYNSKMMDAAINRDDKNRSKINEEKINTIVKNSDALRQAGFDTEITLGNDMASKYLSQHADQINEQVYLKLKKQAADWYNNLSDSDKMSVDRYLLALSSNPSDRQKSIFENQLLNYAANAEQDKARAEQYKYQAEEAKAKAKVVDKLTKAQYNKALVEIENMKKSGLLTDAQTADAWKMVDIHQKDLNWRDANEWQKQISGYINSIGGAVSGVADAIIPF